MVNMQNVQPQASPPPLWDRLRDFQCNRPPIFSHVVEPMDADNWLKSVENKCWGSIIEGYRTPTRKEIKLEREKESGMENDANSCSTLPPPPGRGARAGLSIGEVKGLITMP
jgi:hypothetical protein